MKRYVLTAIFVFSLAIMASAQVKVKGELKAAHRFRFSKSDLNEPVGNLRFLKSESACRSATFHQSETNKTTIEL